MLEYLDHRQTYSMPLRLIPMLIWALIKKCGPMSFVKYLTCILFGDGLVSARSPKINYQAQKCF